MSEFPFLFVPLLVDDLARRLDAVGFAFERTGQRR